ncbi:response regulator [Methanobacterium oryzae]|uniref:response regulator n=1 Tax=Methanobacterium oryzae TaxID=69540 RepID=UPI003D243479
MAKSKIMIVEDERITAEDLKGALESVGYIVPDLISSGEDAVEKAGKIQPDLVLMDIRLEGKMDGIKAAEMIRERYGMPVIYLTAYSDASTVQRAKITEPSGFILKEPFGFIRKPFEESELHTAIEITLYRHKIERRLRDHEQWLKAILKSVNDAIIVTDAKEQVKFMNPIAEDLTGWIQEDAIGEQLDDVFKIVNEVPRLKEILEKNVISGSFNEIIKSKNGIKIPVYGNVTAIKDKSTNINGLVVVFKRIDGN